MSTSTAELISLPTVTATTPRWRSVLRILFRNRLAMVGLFILSVLAFLAIFAPLLATHNPVKPLIGIENVKKRAAPCIHLLGCPEDQPQHYFGTDGNVRDVFSRVLYGARLSLIIGFTTVSFAIVIGTTLGLLSGYFGGWVDNILMRFMDVLLAFPSLLLAIAIVTVLGPGLINALLAIESFHSTFLRGLRQRKVDQGNGLRPPCAPWGRRCENPRRHIRPTVSPLTYRALLALRPQHLDAVLSFWVSAYSIPRLSGG
jgi:ABC-type dipeptide/oligopeptide/nickel transport system permease subunit